MNDEPNSSPLKKSSSLFSPGIQLMFLATICFTIMQTFVKELKPMPTFEITFFRASISALCCFCYLIYYKLPLLGNNHKILFLRAFLGIISMISFFFTLQWMPFGAAVSIKYLSPIFAAIIAIFFLKEKIKPLQWLFFAMALTGVLLLKGFDGRINLFGVGIGLLGALAGGLIYPLIRKIGNSEHPMIIINYFMVTASIVTGLLMIPVWVNPTMQEWLLLITVGISGFAAQVFMTKAFQMEEVNIIAPMKYLEVVYALLIGLIWYGESYAFLSFIGILLIVVAMFLNVRYKQKLQKDGLR